MVGLGERGLGQGLFAPPGGPPLVQGTPPLGCPVQHTRPVLAAYRKRGYREITQAILLSLKFTGNGAVIGGAGPQM